jgi:hypothetical protein
MSSIDARTPLSGHTVDLPASRLMPDASPEAVLRNYFHAKDGNRPHLMSKVFCKTAALQMRVNTDAIAFPASSLGIEAIADVLVRRFAQTYDNVYSYYLERPPAQASRFSCNWLVGMTEKSNGNVRVGCGAYDWEFDEALGLASRLAITIEAMQTLAPDRFTAVFDWLGALSYPWSSAAAAAASAPALEALDPVLRYLRSKADGPAVA